VRDPAFGPEPARRAIADQLPVQAAQVGQDLVEVEAGQERLQRADRGDLDLVAAPDREDIPRFDQKTKSVSMTRYAAE
jgi:hypothetical protein